MPTMANKTPLTFIVVGGLLLMGGWLVPLLMVMRLMPTSYFILSYAMSVGGLAAGLYGVLMYVRPR